MSDGIVYHGIPSPEELAHCPGIPTEERMRRGPVAVIECVQEIPCNPCEAACPFHAIEIGAQITNLPRLKENICTGCGACVASCPGLAITVLNLSYSEAEATIDFPYEYFPLPRVGDQVDAVGRDGTVLCQGRIIHVNTAPAFAQTALVRMAFPTRYAGQVRSMKRICREG